MRGAPCRPQDLRADDDRQACATPGDGQTSDGVLERAERALWEAKRTGRNRVVVDGYADRPFFDRLHGQRQIGVERAFAAIAARALPGGAQLAALLADLRLEGGHVAVHGVAVHPPHDVDGHRKEGAQGTVRAARGNPALAVVTAIQARRARRALDRIPAPRFVRVSHLSLLRWISEQGDEEQRHVPAPRVWRQGPGIPHDGAAHDAEHLFACHRFHRDCRVQARGRPERPGCAPFLPVSAQGVRGCLAAGANVAGRGARISRGPDGPTVADSFSRGDRMKSSEAVLERADAMTHAGAATMKALVYHGPGRRAWEEKPRPRIQEATDAIVRITTTTICGTDLHILKGDVPTVTAGRILGHEGVGIVEEVGDRGLGHPQGRQGAHLLHHVLRALRLLQAQRCTRTAARRLDPRATPSTARRPSTCASRTPTRASTPSRRRGRGGDGHAQRHPADRLRVRRAQRAGEARRHGGHRGRRARSASPRS